jgi:hypothetical protein
MSNGVPRVSKRKRNTKENNSPKQTHPDTNYVFATPKKDSTYETILQIISEDLKALEKTSIERNKPKLGNQRRHRRRSRRR